MPSSPAGISPCFLQSPGDGHLVPPGGCTPPGIQHLWVLLPGAAMPVPGEPTQLGITLTKSQINQPEEHLHHELEDPSSMIFAPDFPPLFLPAPQRRCYMSLVALRPGHISRRALKSTKRKFTPISPAEVEPTQWQLCQNLHQQLFFQRCLPPQMGSCYSLISQIHPSSPTGGELRHLHTASFSYKAEKTQPRASSHLLPVQ